MKRLLQALEALPDLRVNPEWAKPPLFDCAGGRSFRSDFFDRAYAYIKQYY